MPVAPPLPDPPLAAILRGLAPGEAVAVAQALFDAGLRIAEVPLNRPGALEAIAALAAGAHVPKLSPAEMIGPAGLAALRSVLPETTLLWPVGGVSAASLAGWRRAGATGAGIGGQLFRPGRPVAEIRAAARERVAAWRSA